MNPPAGGSCGAAITPEMVAPFICLARVALATSRRYFGFGDSNDYVVIDGGRAIGRIMLHPQAQEAMVLDDHRGGAPTIRL
jgi:hypothetical protein